MNNNRDRAIRSFARRGGRLTDAQRRAIERFSHRYIIDFNHSPLDLDRLFIHSAPCVLEIGFGDGEALVHQATSHPELNFFGIEVYWPGIGKTLAMAQAADLNNLLICNEDAVTVLEKAIKDQSFQEIRIFFPDPWHKKRHHKRRLIQPDFAFLLCRKLIPGGYLHIATDWPDYAEHVADCFAPIIDLTDVSEHSAHARRRSETKYERRGIRLGHPVRDFLYQKTGK